MMVNGDVLEGKITENNDEFGYINFNFTKGNKVKSGTVEHYRVFSIIDADGMETVYYKQDTMMGWPLAESEMRAFILGERDAKLSYKANWTLFGGLAVGAGTVLFDTYRFESDVDTAVAGQVAGFFNSDPSIMPLIVPLVFTAVSMIPKVKVRLGGVSHTEYITDEYYLLGYEKRGRSRRTFNALKGSVGGILLGFASYFAFK